MYLGTHAGKTFLKNPVMANWDPLQVKRFSYFQQQVKLTGHSFYNVHGFEVPAKTIFSNNSKNH